MLRKLWALCIVVVVCSCASFSQWQRAAVPVQYLDITDIHVANPQVVVATGRRGDTAYIVRSDDGGRTFVVAHVQVMPASIDGLRAITSVNDSMLLAVGNVMFLMSIDTGRHWSDASPIWPDSIVTRLGPTYYLRSSASYRGKYTFFSGSTAQHGPIHLRYSPGTDTWQTFESLFYFDGMAAVSEHTLYAHIWEMSMFKSVDTGGTFVRTTRGVFDRVYDLSFPDTAIGWAAGGFVLSTRDGGDTWTSHDVCRFGCSVVVFVDTLHGWIGGDQSLFCTKDGGQTWQDQVPFIDTRPEPKHRWDASHLAAIDSNVAFFGGSDGLWVTFNGGFGSTSVAPAPTTSNERRFEISPNPASDYVAVEFAEAVTGVLSVVDIEGRTVYEFSVGSTQASSRHTIPVEGTLASGVYTIVVRTRTGTTARTLLVAR